MILITIVKLSTLSNAQTTLIDTVTVRLMLWVVRLSVCDAGASSCGCLNGSTRGPIYKKNILRQSYDCLTIIPKLPSTYDGRLIYKTSYNEWKAFHSRAKS